ncbi:SPOR domain-containing protein [Leptospira sp. GIMC2001]|uniref:SPOR domain-containing protein n=1 Tax=Leptospira sp. GIMC2001 TaxID=1513297 RepID=UPI00234A084D|nr:SPOR domain-containing protein [Leptospira sp. GIMC2001]WCL50900.1 SPOR domain-containing protein [Leptospira sp. GIMC2001]
MTQSNSNKELKAEQVVSSEANSIETEKNQESKESSVSQDTTQEPIQLANRGNSPDPMVASEMNPEKAEVIDLQKNIPAENVERQEILHKNSRTVVPHSKTSKIVSSKTDTKSGKYTIQLAAFSQKSMADNYKVKVAADNKKLGQKAFVTKKKNLYLVRIGQSSNMDELKNLISKLNVSSAIKKQAIVVLNI